MDPKYRWYKLNKFIGSTLNYDMIDDIRLLSPQKDTLVSSVDLYLLQS